MSKYDILEFRSTQWQRTSDLSERAPRPKSIQGTDEVDGNPVQYHRHIHGKRSTAGGQDRAESTTGVYLNENAHSTKVVKIIQSYVGIVNKMVWRKEI